MLLVLVVTVISDHHNVCIHTRFELLAIILQELSRKLGRFQLEHEGVHHLRALDVQTLNVAGSSRCRQSTQRQRTQDRDGQLQLQVLAPDTATKQARPLRKRGC